MFLELTRELVGVNEKICELRPVRKVEDEVEMEALKTNCSGGLRGSGAGNSQDGRGYVIQPGVRRMMGLVGAKEPFDAAELAAQTFLKHPSRSRLA